MRFRAVGSVVAVYVSESLVDDATDDGDFLEYVTRGTAKIAAAQR